MTNTNFETLLDYCHRISPRIRSRGHRMSPYALFYLLPLYIDRAGNPDVAALAQVLKVDTQEVEKWLSARIITDLTKQDDVPNEYGREDLHIRSRLHLMLREGERGRELTELGTIG